MSVKRYVAEGCNPRMGLFVTASDYDALEAERDALRLDAERYRWISENADVDCRGKVPEGDYGSLDERIDAAMRGETE